MPTYTYVCKECEMQSVSITRGINEQEQVPVCISCGHRMIREYGLNAIKFSGNGFYSTDK